VTSAGPSAKAGTVEQAIAFGDVILLVVPYTAIEQIGKEFGKALAASIGHRCLEPDTAPRRRGIRQIDQRSGWRRDRRGEMAAGHPPRSWL